MLTQTASTTAESTTKTIWKKSSLLMLILASLGAVFLFVQSSGLKVFPISPHCQQQQVLINDVGLHWKTSNPDTLTASQLMDYFRWSNASACQLTHDFGGKMKKNPSGLDGQKAVCLDVSVAPKAGKCLVYSFGINNEWSFDDAMSQYGCQVYAFDPSMKKESFNRSASIHFFNFGLSSEERTNGKGWQFRTLASTIRLLKPKHGDVVIDYLKMDIEYDEWVVLPQIINSGLLNAKVRQLAVEIHLPVEDSLTNLRRRFQLIRSIEDQGWIRFDSKANPWYTGPFKRLNISGSRGYEIAWYNSNLIPN